MRGVFERGTIGRDVPPGVAEAAMAKVARKQQQVMGDGGVAATPRCHPMRGESVTKIVPAGMGMISIRQEAASKLAKDTMRGVANEWSAGRADEKMLAERAETETLFPIASERANA